MQCTGCGIELQSQDNELVGYIPESKISDQICQRCFQLTHYNYSSIKIDHVDFLEQLDTTLASYSYEDTMIIYIVDLLDIHATLIEGAARRISSYPVIFIGNKLDLLPVTIKYNQVKDWFSKLLRSENIFPTDIWLTSFTKLQGFQVIQDEILSRSKIKNIIVLGTSNVGKSTFVNQLIGTQNKATTSIQPGTTLQPIIFKLTDKTNIIDTPGVLNIHQMTNYLTKDSLKKVLPAKRIRPKSFQIYEPTAIFIERLAVINISTAVSITIITHTSNELKIHRTKLEKSSQIFNSDIFDLPTKNDKIDINTYVSHTLQTTKPKQDIEIFGLGYITIHGKGTKIELKLPQSIHFQLRDSIL